MFHPSWVLFVLLAMFSLVTLTARDGWSSRDEDEEEHHGSRRGSYSKALVPASDPVYREECGDCHYVYPPGLLPWASWVRLIVGLDDHFGESVSLEPDDRNTILVYLKDNAADFSFAERSWKIVRSLNGDAPLRIIDVPYIRDKHDEVAPEVLQRKAVGSLSNCDACHTTAEEADFSEDNVVIPDA